MGIWLPKVFEHLGGACLPSEGGCSGVQIGLTTTGSADAIAATRRGARLQPDTSGWRA